MIDIRHVYRTSSLQPRWRVRKAWRGVVAVSFALGTLLLLRMLDFLSAGSSAPAYLPLAFSSAAVVAAATSMLWLHRYPVTFELVEFFTWCTASLVVAYGTIEIPNEAMRYRMQIARFYSALAFPLAVNQRLVYYVPYALWTFVHHSRSAQLSAELYQDHDGTVEVTTGYAMVVALYCIASWWQAALLNCFQGAEQQVAQEKQATESLLSMLADAWFVLSGDGETILRADPHFDGLIGKATEGQRMQALFSESAQHEHFRSVLSTAEVDEKPFPVTAFPITLLTTSRSRVRATAYVVGQKRVETSLTKRTLHTTFLVGICQTDEEEFTEAEPLPDSLAQRQPLRTAMPEVQSVADTAEVFQGVAQAEHEGADVKSALQKMVDIGRAEHWLIEPQDVKICQSSTIGSGGFGSVMGGRYFGAPVVVKIAKEPVESRNLEAVAALCNELRVLRHSRHPNLVQFKGAILDVQNALVGLVLECVPQGNLDMWMDSERSTSSAGRYRILLGVCRALWYLHSRTPVIVHGDIKGGNVLICTVVRDETAKLVDFGLSRVLRGDSRSLGGTLAWMAPEVFRSKRRAPDKAADVFSFGRLLSFVVTGVRPFQECSRRQIEAELMQKSSKPLGWDMSTPLMKAAAPVAEACLSFKTGRRPDMHSCHEQLSAWPHVSFDDLGLSARAMAMAPGRLSPWHEFFGTAAEVLDAPQASEALEALEGPAVLWPTELEAAAAGDLSAAEPPQDPFPSASSADTTTAQVQDLVAHITVKTAKHHCCSLHAAVHEIRQACTSLLGSPCGSHEALRKTLGASTSGSSAAPPGSRGTADGTASSQLLIESL